MPGGRAPQKDGFRMELKPGYKQTEVGVIPEDWNVAKLGDLLIREPSYGINAPGVSYSDRLPKYIRITDITESGRYSPENVVSVNHLQAGNYYLSNGDIVLARTGASVGKSYLYQTEDGSLVFAGFLIRVTPNGAKLLPEYLSAYLQTDSYWNWVRLTSMRSGQPGINGNEYAQLPLPLPPSFAEQRAIATVLSDMDALLTKLDALIAKKRDLKQAAMQQLLTGKQRLPGFSGEWEVKQIGEFTDCASGGTPSTSVPAYWGGSIRWMSSGELNLKKIEEVGGRITEQGLRNSSARMIPMKCILVGLAGQGRTRGTVAMNLVQISINQSIAAILPNPSFVPEYLYYNLDSRFA